uniref:Pto-like serine/threonine kinase n=1 Tax=Solanum tuberosum TaxID=4113 RepID=M1ACZ5_SOLTU
MVRLTEWAVESQKKGQLEQIVDPNLLVKIRPESLRKFGETTVKCLAGSGLDRPSMSDVLWNLEYALHLQEPVIPDYPEEDSSFPIRELLPLINDFTDVDASSNVAQVGTSNLDDISSDELISPR